MAFRRTGYKAGDEVDSKCTKCKLILAHTIIAMVGDQIARVKCNTCGGEHAYRPPPTASEATAKKRRAERKASSADKLGVKATAAEYEAVTKGRDLSKAQQYDMKMEHFTRERRKSDRISRLDTGIFMLQTELKRRALEKENLDDFY